MSKTYLKEKIKTVNTSKVKPSVREYNVVSLFSGVGGMDLGFMGDFNFLNHHYGKNPFNIVFSNDIFKQAADVYDDNFKVKHKVERRDISELDLEKDFPDKQVDIVLGGFPCQSFSYSGKRGGLTDPRGQLYLQMIRVIKHYKPKMFVAENVDGIRTSLKNNEKNDSSALDIILQDFDAAGYNVQYHVLNAADYGVPQSRRRVIIMGIRKDLGNNDSVFYPEPQFDKEGTLTGNRWRNSKDGIDDLWDKVNSPDVANHTSRDISKAKFYPGKKMQGNVQIKEDRPAPTIRAEHHGNIEAHYRTFNEDESDMNGWRRLSVRECARLQSFPDDFIFTTSASSAYKGIGNAVPPLMAWHIARAVQNTLNNI